MNAPATIGPYRLEGRLGRGGMGEVHRGYDQRLERPVALKRLARAAAADAGARRRLRREARAAARLNHPAIVQVYDVVFDEDDDWIVMELVEGRTMAELAAGQALPLADALRWGRQVAEGLAAAHARGIVHRDLKLENVMIADDGRAAKILDFGLAKHLPDAGATASTEEGVVVGTVRALSPEQAMGNPVDARADLFALGILLYETLAGRSPFLGDGPADTLKRICTLSPPPLSELDASLSQDLSQLVDQLLAKEPALRPQSAAEVARRLALLEDAGAADAAAPPATVYPGTTLVPASDRSGDVRPWRRRWWIAAAAVVFASIVAWRLLPPSSPVAAAEPLYVATLPPRLVSGGDLPGIDLVADGVRVALLRGLVSLAGIAALAPERVDEIDGAPRDLARAVAADEVLSPRLSCRADACALTLSRLTADEQVTHTETIEVPTDDFALLTRAVTAQVRRAYGEYPWRSSAPEPAMESAEYETFLRLRGDYLARRRPLPEILDELDALRRRAPRAPESLLLEARVARYRYAETRDPSDFERAAGAVAEARRLAPDDPEVLAETVQVARAGDDAELATTALENLETVTPGDAQVAISRAWWLERRGEADAALELMRRAARRRPAWYALLGLANLEIRHGDVAAARRTLNELLERAPGQYTALSLLAQLELTGGDLERAVELYSDLVRRSPGPIQQSNLGVAYLLSRRYDDAAASFAAAHEAAPGNPLIALNLADARLLAGERVLAEAMYRRTLELYARDPASLDWQGLTTRAQAEARLGLGRQAVASVREALRLAPDSPHAAYYAALVFLLVGEEASAAVEAERALDLGLEPRWFELEWFDVLREDRRLAERLTAAAR